MELDLLY